MKRDVICQYDNCLEVIGERGVTVTLRTVTPNDERRAVYCCAAHAAASLLRLAEKRSEPVVDMPTYWKVR